MKEKLGLALRVVAIVLVCIAAYIAIKLKIEYWQYSNWYVFLHATRRYISGFLLMLGGLLLYMLPDWLKL